MKRRSQIRSAERGTRKGKLRVPRSPLRASLVNDALPPEIPGSHLSPQRVQQSIRMRFNPIRALTPDVLSRQLDSFQSGYLREAAISWDAIERRDAMLKNVAMKRKKSVARNGWEILTVDDSEEAMAQKEALEFFYNNLSATNALEQNESGSLSLLLRQMMDAVGKRYAVHEIIWQPQNVASGLRPENSVPESRVTDPTLQPGLDSFLTAQFVFVPLWFFENRSGKLRFLQSETSVQGIEMKEREWLVTVGDGIMEGCSVAWMYKNLSLKDWVAFSEKFGMPGLLGKTDSAKGSEQWNALKDAVEVFGQDWAAVCSRADEIATVELKGSQANLPYPPLVEYMDRALASLWRGADLATISKGEGAIGASLQANEGDILLEDDLKLCEEALNEQATKPCLDYLFGTTRCLAYLKLTRPQQKNVDQDLKVDTFLRDSGVPQAIKDVAERYERPLPEEGEDVLQAPTPAPASGPSPTLPPSRDPQFANENQTVQVHRLAAAFAEDLTPLRMRLERILTIEDPDLLRSKLEALLKQIPQLLSDMNADPESARVLEDALQRGLLNGAKKEVPA